MRTKSLSRRGFLAAGGAAVWPLAAALTAQADSAATGGAADAEKHPQERAGGATPPPIENIEIAPGCFVHRGQIAIADHGNGGDIANLGFIVGSRSVAIIDTGGSAHLGAKLEAAVAAKTDLPISHVINTHMHPDHVLGNAAFKRDGVTFVGHHKLAAALTARREFYLRRAAEQLGADGFAGTDVVVPTMAVTDRTEIDLGGRTLVLEARETAHTDNDLTVRDSATDTVYLGDLLFAQHIPTLDGSVLGWLALIDKLKTEKAARVVPGHGPAHMTWPDAIAPMEAYWRDVVSGVRKAIADNVTLRDATETVAQDQRTLWQLFDEHHIRNVGAAYAELEWE